MEYRVALNHPAKCMLRHYAQLSNYPPYFSEKFMLGHNPNQKINEPEHYYRTWVGGGGGWNAELQQRISKYK